jgi:hypothetical protein
MVLEFLIASTKLIFIFIGIAVFVLSLLFKTMSGAAYYYYLRDLDFLSDGNTLTNAIKITEKFKPVLNEIEIQNNYKFTVKAKAFNSVRFNRNFSSAFTTGVLW